MESESPSRSFEEMEQSFSIAAGDFTEAEKQYLRMKGLLHENSMDISTDVGSMNCSSLNSSSNHSLLIFEETERVYSEVMSGSAEKSLNKCGKSPFKTPERPLSKLSKKNESPISTGFEYSPSPTGAESDKENEFKGPMCAQRRILFLDEPELGKRDPLEEIKGITDLSPVNMIDAVGDDCSSTHSQTVSDLDEELVPCTQEPAAYMDVSLNTNPEDDDDNFIVACTQAVQQVQEEQSLPVEEINQAECILEQEGRTVYDLDSQQVVLCSQSMNLSLNLNQTYTSVTLEESLVLEDSQELVPATQALESSSIMASSQEATRFEENESVPCSQGSTVGGNSTNKSELDDTITRMEYLLKLADEQEEREKAEEAAAAAAVEHKSKDNISSQSEGEEVPAETEEVLFKTPLKCPRVQLLKKKKVASPSPPRTFANQLLQQRGGPPPKKPLPTVEKKTTVNPARKSVSNSGISSPSKNTANTPLSTSTPKRTPLTNITPVPKKNYTPGRGGILKTPVSAKVDTGLRGSGFPIGLSPVAKYIYDKPVPSQFARVQGIPNPKAAESAASKQGNMSKIPLPPPKTSFVPNSKTPASATKRANNSGALKTSTYFNLTSTPPQIVANEKVVQEKKRFPSLQYSGSQKVKTLSGKVESPRKEEFVAHRHTGLRDDSGNASFIQNTVVTKRNIPIQSRLATPKSYIRSKIVNEEGMRETVDEVDGCIADTLKLVRSNTFVISKNSQQLNTN